MAEKMLMPPSSGLMPQPCLRDVAAPDEADIAAARWRRAEAADQRLAGDVDVREVAEAGAIEDGLIGRQVLDQHFRGEVAFR